MAFSDIVIDILNINCSMVQCSGYANEIEALFYLLFFPTVFIILFIFIVTNAITKKVLDGSSAKALAILIAIALFAFIIFEGFYSLFASLSQLWWLLLATLVGLWIFVRKFLDDDGSAYSGIKGRGFSGAGVFNSKAKAISILNKDPQKLRKIIKSKMSELERLKNSIIKERENPSQGTDMSNLVDRYGAKKTETYSYIDELEEYGKARPGKFEVQVFDWSRKYKDKIAHWDEEIAKG